MDQPTFLIYAPSVGSAYSLLSVWPPSLSGEDVDQPLLNPPLGRPLPSYNYADRTWGAIASVHPFQRAVFSDLALFNAWIAQLWSLPPETGAPNPIIVMGRNDILRGVRTSRADIYRRALASFNVPASSPMSTPTATSLVLTPSLLLPNLVRPVPTSALLGPLTARTTVGNPIILIFDPANVYTEYESTRKDVPINEELSVSCSATFRPCPGIRRGVFTDLALFNAWIAKIWGLPPESGSPSPIVVLGRRDITRGGAQITSRDMEIRADANFAADPDTNTRPAPGTPAPGGSAESGGGSTPTAPTTNNTPVWGGTIQLFSIPGCSFCTAAMNYLASIGVPAERIEITSASDPRLVSALARASVSVRGGIGTPLIIHTKGTPRLTQGFNAADLRARYFESAPSTGGPAPLPGVISPGSPGTPVPDPSTPEAPPPALTPPVFTSTFVGPLTYSFATEGTAARSWSFGDGRVSMEPNPTHTYEAPGTYTIGLRMPADSENVATATLNVLAAGIPGTAASSAPVAQSKSTPFPFLVGAGVMYGVYSLWRRLRR